jgi:MoaA/NifB/PqqE/SkfB family radical SAM enzyme
MYGGDEVSYERVTGRKGMYDKVIRTFVLLNDSGIHFEIKYIGMKENEEDFLKVKKVAEVFGAVFSYSMELFPTLLGDSCPKNHMMELEKIVKTEMLSEGYADYSGPLAHPGRSLAQLDRASAHSARSAVQPMLAADQHTC